MNSTSHKQFLLKKVAQVVLATVFLVVMFAFLVMTLRADTPLTASFQAENGVVSSPATTVTDTTAAGGNAVNFGAGIGSGANFLPPLPAYPDPGCTGAKGTLSTVNGGMTAGTAGQTLQNTQYSGQIKVTANDVTIKNVKIVTNDTYGILVRGQNVTIRDVTIVGGANTEAGLASTAGGTFVAYRLNVSGAGDGVRADSSKLFDSYVTTGTSEGPHHDTVMGYGRGWGITHNYLFNPNDETSVASLVWDGETPSEGILQDNFLAGAGFTVYGGLPVGEGIRVLNNVFSTKYYAQSGYYGYLYPNQKPNVWLSNKWYDGPNAGQTIPK